MKTHEELCNDIFWAAEAEREAKRNRTTSEKAKDAGESAVKGFFFLVVTAPFWITAFLGYTVQ